MADKGYSLTCRQPPHMNIASADHFTDLASRYRHSIRWQGGYWEATWSFIPTKNNGITVDYLKDWFENRLMYRIEEQSGGIISWEGVVWSMVLTLNGKREERSMLNLYNATRTFWTDTDGEVHIEAWSTNQDSIDRYGRRELRLELDSITQSIAQARQAKALIESLEAWPRTTGINTNWPDQLEVTAVGDIFTANNKFVTAATGSTYNGRVSNIISTDCEFLSTGGLAVNSLVPEALAMDTRAWDVLLTLVEDGDGSQPWRLWCDTGGRVWYQPANNTPAYEYRGRAEGLTDTEGNKSPWLVKPGVVRDMTRRKTTPIPGSFLSDGRDSWVQEVEMADGMTEPNLKPAGLIPEDIQMRAELYQSWMEREQSS